MFFKFLKELSKKTYIYLGVLLFIINDIFTWLKIDLEFTIQVKIIIVLILIIFACFFMWIDSEKNNLTKNKNLEHDLKLLEEFQNDFTKDNYFLLDNLKDHDLGNPFSNKYLYDLIEISNKWNKIDKEFLDKQVEHEKKLLIKNIKDFVDLLIKKSFTEGEEFRTTRLDKINYPKVKYEDIENIIISLNNQATKIYDDFNVFIRNTKNKLYN